MEPASILALVNGLVSTAFNIYRFLKSISGDVAIPTWEEILKKNIDLQNEIDAAKGQE